VEKEAAATGKAAGAEEGRTTPQPRADDDEDADGSPGDDSSPSPPPPPPTEPSDPPLLEANVPGVGSVTVEQTDLPDADVVLPETPTLPAP
jgi:hypothetical protein